MNGTGRLLIPIIPPGSPTLSSYAVYEFETDNPGVWREFLPILWNPYSVHPYMLTDLSRIAFHCHIIGHVSGGLYINIMVYYPYPLSHLAIRQLTRIRLQEQPDLITQLPIPATVAQTCRDWAAWTGDNVVDQIDSGL